MKSVSKALASLLLISVVSVGSSYAQENSQKEEGEESGKRYSLTESCEELRNGVQLNLSYDEASENFTGTIKNVTSKAIDNIRITVHLSNGSGPDPTKPVSLKPGATKKVKIGVKGKQFKWWTTHAEVCNSEHEHGKGGEHGHEREGMHEHH